MTSRCYVSTASVRLDHWRTRDLTANKDVLQLCTWQSGWASLSPRNLRVSFKPARARQSHSGHKAAGMTRGTSLNVKAYFCSGHEVSIQNSMQRGYVVRDGEAQSIILAGLGTFCGLHLFCMRGGSSLMYYGAELRERKYGE